MIQLLDGWFFWQILLQSFGNTVLSKYTASRIEVLETTLINFQSVYAVEAYNTSLVISWMDVIFENQNQLYDFQTMDKNRYDVIK